MEGRRCLSAATSQHRTLGLKDYARSNVCNTRTFVILLHVSKRWLTNRTILWYTCFRGDAGIRISIHISTVSSPTSMRNSLSLALTRRSASNLVTWRSARRHGGTWYRSMRKGWSVPPLLGRHVRRGRRHATQRLRRMIHRRESGPALLDPMTGPGVSRALPTRRSDNYSRAPSSICRVFGFACTI